jgi:hypothetical protein
MAAGFAVTVTSPFDAFTVTGKALADDGADDEPDIAPAEVSEPVAALVFSPTDVPLSELFGDVDCVEMSAELGVEPGAELCALWSAGAVPAQAANSVIDVAAAINAARARECSDMRHPPSVRGGRSASAAAAWGAAAEPPFLRGLV